jgi:hypothetical protein
MDADEAFALIQSALVARRQGMPTSFKAITVPPGTILKPVPSWLAKGRSQRVDLAELLAQPIVDQGSAALLADTEFVTDCWCELARRRRKRGLHRLERAMKAVGVSRIEWLDDARLALGAIERPSKGNHRLYAVLLGGFGRKNDEHGVYVGETKYRPEVRLLEHLTDADPETGVVQAKGMRMSSRFVRRRGIELLPSLVAHLDRFAPADAKGLEAEVAEALKAIGIRVRGGH